MNYGLIIQESIAGPRVKSVKSSNAYLKKGRHWKVRRKQVLLLKTKDRLRSAAFVSNLLQRTNTQRDDSLVTFIVNSSKVENNQTAQVHIKTFL
jgi:hypothetical protein